MAGKSTYFKQWLKNYIFVKNMSALEMIKGNAKLYAALWYYKELQICISVQKQYIPTFT